MSENNNVKDDMIIGRVHKGQYRSLKDDLNLIVATKIKQKIDTKKDEFISNLRKNT